MKSSASELKLFQGEIPGRARRKERLGRSKLKQVLLINSDAKLLMYLLQCIRFGSWKVRGLNGALIPLTSGIQYLESRIHGMESQIQDFLGLPFMRRVVVDDVFFFRILTQSLMSYI